MTTPTGYRSYSYLEAGRDYPAFELAAEIGRVPAHQQPLSDAERARVERLIRESIIVSLHDHPCVYPLRIEEVAGDNRAGRQVTGFQGLSRSGITAVFDNLMDGACCITAPGGWKWNDILHDLGMRLCDLAHQDAVRGNARVLEQIW